MWNIQLLGGLEARSAERTVTRFRYHKAGSLLGYLAYFSHAGAPPVSRETLITMLWPDADPESGRKNLRNLLSALRPVLEPPGLPMGAVIIADRFTVSLQPAAIVCDVHRFEEAAKKATRQGISDSERLSLLARAVELYRGELMPGYYDEWIGPVATRLSTLFLEAAGQVVPLLIASDQLDLALSVAQRAVAADPMSEETTWGLMRVLEAQQQPGLALRAYRKLHRKLHEEWEETPSEELQAYARQLRGRPSLVIAPVANEEAVCTDAPGVAETIPAAQVPALLSGTPQRVSRSARLLGAEFTALRSTRFFDRETETARLSDLLSGPRTRLVTVTGPGGIGKTRLAVETVARLVEHEEPEGIAPRRAAFVALGHVADPSRVYEAILRATGCDPVPGAAPLDLVCAALSQQDEMILLLDNFEQLAERGADLVRDLLDRVPSIKCLVTSRQTLRLEAEHEIMLSPLPTPGGPQTPEALLSVPSIALFVDRAQMVRPNFQVTVQNAATLAKLCDRLEGIPLAIELAAARLQVLSAAHILEQTYQNRLDFLATTRRDATSRQRTMRSNLDWSYQLLSEPAQTLLAQASVFRGGWTLEAAQAVCALGEVETLEMLGLLRNNSLLQVRDDEDELRFNLLETVREYAAERLERIDDRGSIKRRHAAYFLDLAETEESQSVRSDEPSILRSFRREHENFRAAIGWANATGEVDLRARLGVALLPVLEHTAGLCARGT